MKKDERTKTAQKILREMRRKIKKESKNILTKKDTKKYKEGKTYHES